MLCRDCFRGCCYQKVAENRCDVASLRQVHWLVIDRHHHHEYGHAADGDFTRPADASNADAILFGPMLDEVDDTGIINHIDGCAEFCDINWSR